MITDIHEYRCAPLLLPWLGEVEGTSLAMSQANALPVPAHVPMFRVPTVLPRVLSAVPPTVVGACDRRQKCTSIIRVFHAVFCDMRTQYNPLSAHIAKNRVKNVYDGGTFLTSIACALSESTIYNAYVPMTRATHLTRPQHDMMPNLATRTPKSSLPS